MTEPWKTKRFILFAGREYYPLGGILDYSGSFDTKEEAVVARDVWLSENDMYVWTQIADLATGDYDIKEVTS